MIMANANPAPDPYAEACAIAGDGPTLYAALIFASEELPAAEFASLRADLAQPETRPAALRDLVDQWREQYKAATGEYP